MRRLPVLLCGLASLTVLVIGSGLIYLRLAAKNFSARAQPTRLEVALAVAARRAAMPAALRDRKNPVDATPQALQQGMEHFADHCAQCHGNNGAGETMLGSGMYPKPPDMRRAATQRKSDGELFGAIENGIRLSGMPAFGGGPGSEDASWKLVVFLRHLPQLTVAEEVAMQRLNPKGPAEVLEEKEEDNFLHGADTTAAGK